MANPNNYFDSEKAKLAKEKQKRGRSFKTMFRDIMQEKLSPALYEEIREEYGLNENIEQGEAAARAIIHKCIKRGDTKSLIDILKVTGEYTEKVALEGGDSEKPIYVITGQRRIKGEYEESRPDKETEKL